MSAIDINKIVGTESIRHQEQRRTLWIESAIAAIQNGKCVHNSEPGELANRVLADFDRRFPDSIDIEAYFGDN